MPFKPHTAIRCRHIAALAVVAAAAAPALALADWKPSRPVTIVVPYVAGGGTDTTARATARLLSEQWGQPVVVENVPGADGLIGTRRVNESKPDGHTLLLQTPAIVLTKHAPAFSSLTRCSTSSARSAAPAVLSPPRGRRSSPRTESER